MCNRFTLPLAFVCLLITFLAIPVLAQAQSPSLSALPLSFEQNKGQAPADYQFLARRNGVQTYYLSDGIDVAMPQSKTNAHLLQLRWSNPDPKVTLTGESPLLARSNYFRGSEQSSWLRAIAHFGQVRYQHLYPGIDAVFHGTPEFLEHDFIVQPGADPAEIAFHTNYPGRVTPSGDLEFDLGGSSIRLRKPIAYQEIATVRHEVSATYLLARNGEVRFALGDYDHSQTLVIDPVFVFSTYLSGSVGNDQITAVTTNAAGEIFVTGFTAATDFPVTNAANPLCTPCTDVAETTEAFISKLDPTGRTLLYSTLLGGTHTSGGFGTFASSIALDANGNIYVSGVTSSADFPHAGAATVTPSIASADFFFVSSLKPDGSAFNYSGRIGGGAIDPNQRYGVMTVDAAGNAYLAGSTQDATFQLTPGTLGPTQPRQPFPTLVALKLDPTGKLLYSTLVPGNSAPPQGAEFANNFMPWGVHVDALGQFTIAGTGGLGLPTTPNALQATIPHDPASLPDPQAGFVLQLNSSASALNYATYIPGADLTYALSVDAHGNLYLAGATGLSNLPVTAAAFQKSPGTTVPETVQGYIMELDPTAQHVLAASYLGGGSGSSLRGVAVDSSGNVLVDGFSFGSDFPIKNPLISGSQLSPITPTTVIAELNNNLSSLLFGTYLAANYESALIFDLQDKAIVTGFTSDPDFPTTSGSYQAAAGGNFLKSFITKLDLTVAAPSVCLSSNRIDFGSILVNTPRTQNLTVTNCGNAALQISNVTSSPSLVTATQACGSIAPGATCAINLTFTPTTTDAVSGTIIISDNAAISQQTVTFFGKGGTPQVFFPPSISLYDLLVGTSGEYANLFSNSGDGAWLISNVSITGDFSLHNQCPSSVPPFDPTQITGTPPMNSCILGIIFSPTAAGLRTGTLTITDNVTGSPHVISVLGDGLLTYPTPSIIAAVATPTDIQPNTLNVIGNNFFPASQIKVNGTTRITHYLNQEFIYADATASDLAQLGEMQVTVSNPGPGGGQSNSSTWTLYSAIRNIRTLQSVYDSKSGLLYSSVEAQSPNYAGQVVAIDPATATVVHAWTVGNGPNRLTVSDDGQFLYVGLDGDAKVAQVSLPAGTINFAAALGSDPVLQVAFHADALAVLPGHPHSWVVTLCGQSVPCGEGIAIYDDAVKRSTGVSQPGVEPGTLLFIGNDIATVYGATQNQLPPTLYKFAIDAGGISLTQSVTGTASSVSFPSGQLDSDGSSLYANDGEVIDPANLTTKTTIPIVASHAGIKVDSASSRAYFAGSTNPPLFGAFLAGASIQAFDLPTQKLMGTIPMNEGAAPAPGQLFRWSTNGLALTSEFRIYFLRTSLTSSAAAMPQFGVSGLTPATVLAASPDVALKIAGNGFASGDTVIANGTPLPATFVSPSEIDLTVPASLLTTPGNVQIAITTPAPGSQTAYLVLIIAPAGPVASVSTNFVTFDALLVGNTSAPKTVTLTNNGTAPLTVSSITATGDFSQSNNCATIVPGAICTINVVFSPTAPNDRFGMLTIYDDAPSAPQTTALMGTGADVQIAPGTTGGATANVAIGQPANYALTITPAAFTGQVSFSCTNLPLHAACTITPPTATLSAAPLNVSVTISTSQQTAMLAPASTAETTFAGLSWTGLVLLIALWPVRRVLRESRFAAASGIVVLTLCVISMTCFAFTGCGGGSSSGTTPPPTQPSALTTPAGTYTVNFVATSSSGSRAMPLTLVVH